MKPHLKWVLAASSSIGLCAAVFVAGRAWAGGIPTTAPVMTYAGTLENADGSPITEQQIVEVRLWPTDTPGKKALCTSAPQTVAPDKHGRFSVALDACATVIAASPDLWAEVLLGTASLGTAKLGAVPYAIEAAHATSASAAEGDLKTSVDGLAESMPQLTEWKTEAAPPILWSDGTKVPVTKATYVWRRVGDSVEVRVGATLSSAVSSIIFGAPPGLALDATKGGDIGASGGGRVVITASSTIGLLNCFPSSFGGVSCIGAGAAPPYLGSGWPSGSYSVDIQYTIPVKGWTTTKP